ncbi:hypothetical protein LTR17_015719 [Elasticomyces elasticus]|nr:hypothetical protein LTR17_015719 [Elasticomyces elasticus]
MAEHLLQEYFDRAQAAEQATLQLKMERAEFGATVDKAVDDYRNTITGLGEQLAEKGKQIAELEKTIEDTKNQAPSNLVVELKEMLRAAVEKVDELAGAATRASATTVKEEPENDDSADDLGFFRGNVQPKKKGSPKRKFATYQSPQRALRKETQNGDRHIGPVRTWYVPPHLWTKEQAAAAARFLPGPQAWE